MAERGDVSNAVTSECRTKTSNDMKEMISPENFVPRYTDVTEVSSTDSRSSSFPADSIIGSSITNKRAYISVAILCFINLINYMDRYTLAGVLPNVQAYYGLNNSEGGLLQTSFIVSYMIMAPIFGYLGDRYSRRLIIACGVTFWSATTLLGSFVPSGYFGWFLLLRALVGTGEASYSTIAPTIIADLFADTSRTRMLALFYFAIPVGSGLGYIVGSEVANLFGHWYWALRVTPGLGILSVILALVILGEPPRGEAEGGVNLKNTSLMNDLISVLKIPSFMWVTLGFTCVTFSIGALAWWVPAFIKDAIEVQGGKADLTAVSLIFGVITCFAGIVGVLLGSGCSQYYRRFNQRADPLICAYSLLIAIPLVYFATIVAHTYTALAYVLIFFGVTALCMNWAIVADIVLYVVIPTRRSLAEAIQITISHAFGDACSPYVVGAISDAITAGKQTVIAKHTGLEYALFVPVFILALGGLCFFISSWHIIKDKENCQNITHGHDPSSLYPSNGHATAAQNSFQDNEWCYSDTVHLVREN